MGIERNGDTAQITSLTPPWQAEWVRTQPLLPTYFLDIPREVPTTDIAATLDAEMTRVLRERSSSPSN